jgi:hypothetical protein
MFVFLMAKTAVVVDKAISNTSPEIAPGASERVKVLLI